ncbi:aminoglycoside 6'-N-acetyltransferase [Pseudomonas sp. GM84]|uniref:aminoglycoside 6'-N-acetyltransferase n=1 Tax=Pseudomonas sp. GM84 TaxID=1144340 RepID=UPI0006ACDB2F|nr:aminoglycoside 6'-N-acetyltransferase [Pseudomonas sp. GM84]
MIQVCEEPKTAGWLELRSALWPNCSVDEHLTEMADIARNEQSLVAFLALDELGRARGLAEASVRHDYVNGTTTSPVAFLEGIYVIPSARGQGVARQLIAAVEQWAADKGCEELASDAALDNHNSHLMHTALGFTETERVVYFLKSLPVSG